MSEDAEPFASVVDALNTTVVRPDITLEVAPAPSRLAPHAHAVTAEVGDPEVGSGRFVLLHDPQRPEAWEADTRIVVYVEADVGSEMVHDQLLTDVGWSWLQECLADNAAQHRALGGTVTAVRSTSYEALAARGHESTVQIRASWSTDGLDEIPAHFAAWLALMEISADLPPFHPDVTRIGDIP